MRPRSSPKWLGQVAAKEGFLPVTKVEADAPVFTNDPQLKAFTDHAFYAHFAPPIPNWEQAADATIRALQLSIRNRRRQTRR